MVAYPFPRIIGLFRSLFDSELKLLSARRTPDAVIAYTEAAESAKVEVMIAGTGNATHLAVIGAPIPTENLRGLDSLLSIVQMPKGIPVATITIGGAENAALLAVSILSLKYPKQRQKLLAFRAEQTRASLEGTPMVPPG